MGTICSFLVISLADRHLELLLQECDFPLSLLLCLSLDLSSFLPPSLSSFLSSCVTDHKESASTSAVIFFFIPQYRLLFSNFSDFIFAIWAFPESLSFKLRSFQYLGSRSSVSILKGHCSPLAPRLLPLRSGGSLPPPRQGSHTWAACLLTLSTFRNGCAY